MTMRRVLWVIAIFALALAAPLHVTAAAPTYSNLYVFGDSYCDVGNIFAATGQPGVPYWNGRLSNGPIWVEHIANYLGLPLQPSLAGGTDYAFAGAWVTQSQDLGGGAILPSVPMQVQMYLQAHDGKADPNALYFIDGGGNDIVKTTTGSPDALGYQIAVGLADSEQMLRQAGARHFIIPNLFNVGLLPVAADHVAFAKAASASANAWLDRLLWFEVKLPKVHILRIDVDSLMNAIQKDTTHFGFTDVTHPCLTDTLCTDPDHTFFWDAYHPTVFGHAFFAVIIENAIANPTD
jgi:outer membrane lipase/esterase